jgi:hypothetical protein
MAKRDWVDWHRDYDADTPLARRLATVQRQIRAFADAAPPGPIHAISMCAGEGRDLIGGLADHSRRADLRARLVELDPRNVAAASASAARAGMPGVEVVQGDAGITTAYEGAVPADLVLVCGVYGNVSDADIAATVAALPSLAARGATTIWTRSRRDPDITPELRRWYADAGFEEVAFEPIEESLMTVGTWRFVGEPRPFEQGRRLFTFLPQKAAGPDRPSR